MFSINCNYGSVVITIVDVNYMNCMTATLSKDFCMHMDQLLLSKTLWLLC